MQKGNNNLKKKLLNMLLPTMNLNLPQNISQSHGKKRAKKKKKKSRLEEKLSFPKYRTRTSMGVENKIC